MNHGPKRAFSSEDHSFRDLSAKKQRSIIIGMKRSQNDPLQITQKRSRIVDEDHNYSAEDICPINRTPHLNTERALVPYRGDTIPAFFPLLTDIFTIDAIKSAQALDDESRRNNYALIVHPDFI